MKIYIKQIATLAIFIAVMACSSNEPNIETQALGGNVVLNEAEISRLDGDYDIALSLFLKQGVAVNKVEIYDGETTKKITDAVVGSDAKATFNSSHLIPLEAFTKTGSISLDLNASYSDGTTSTSAYSLRVSRGFKWYAKGKPTDKAGVTSVRYLDPLPKTISCKVFKKTEAPVEYVKFSWKKAGDTDFTAGAPISAEEATNVIDLDVTKHIKENGYVVGDKITYRYDVKLGNLQDYIEQEVVVETQEFDDPKESILSNDIFKNKLNLKTNKTYPDTDKTNAEIKFATTGVGFEKEGEKPIDFVKLATPTEGYFINADLFKVEEDYNAGTKVTSVNDLAVGEIFIYKIVRKVDFGTEEKPDVRDVSYYGKIWVQAVTDGINTPTKSFAFLYKEGYISR